MVNKIKIGQDIRDKVFKGNPYSQLASLRLGIKALNILRKEDSSEKNKLWAKAVLSDLEKLDEQIEEML